MRPKSMEPMSVRGRDQWFLKARRHFHGTSIRIEKPAPKMTKLDRIEAVDFFDQLLSNRTTKDVKWMRRDGEERRPPTAAQLFQIIQAPERFNFARTDVEQNDVSALKPNFSGGDKENTHPGGIRKDFRAIENGVVQRNCEDTKSE